MTYTGLASVYDHLMANAPYEKWVQYVQQVLADVHTFRKPIQLIDVGCGTGELAVRLGEHGFSVSGIDFSEEMLAIAQNKAEEWGVKLPLFHQDMRELRLPEKFDVITIFCDSLNYLREEEDVRQTLKACFQQLESGGYLLFDVHSIEKMNRFIHEEPFYEIDDDVSYIWSCEEGKHTHSVDHDLTFFVQKDQSQDYERFDEQHTQRTYPVEQWENWIEEAGFSLLSVTADFTNKPPTKQSDRIFFCACKEKQPTS